MRHSSNKRLLLVALLAAICLELAWLLWPRLNLFSDPYRFPERQNALREWGRQRTPETRAVLDREHQLLEAHQHRIALLIIAAIVVEGAAVTFIVQHSILSRHENAA